MRYGYYVQCLNLAPMEKAWFYERFLFEVAIVMVKDERKHNKKIQKK